MCIIILLFFIWCLCVAASNADDTMEQWNKNWTEQKFDKERK